LLASAVCRRVFGQKCAIVVGELMCIFCSVGCLIIIYFYLLFSNYPTYVLIFFCLFSCSVYLFSILRILCFCIVLFIVSLFAYSCFVKISVHVYKPLPPDGNAIAVNKYHITLYHIISHFHCHGNFLLPL